MTTAPRLHASATCTVALLSMAGLGQMLHAEENPHGDVFKNRPVPAIVDYNRDVRPIISEKCFHCHGADESSRKAKLRLDLRDEAVKDHKGTFAVKPKDPDNSEVMKRILTKDPDEVMPPPEHGHALSARETEILRKWIAQGAEYAEHWAFVPPVKRMPGGKMDPIDGWIAQKQKEHGLALSPEADRYTLIRRVALDLTGLPPSPEEVKAYLEDTSDTAYASMVDRFLAKPAYGERWARVWLDIARYADSAGYGSDPLRLNIWPYRDWVIEAFNRNLPYDQFTIEQIAGDLLPNATESQLVATAFHRNTMTNTEGGTDDEEFRVAAVKDRIATTMQTWMGLTLGCAQCHSHKFDPITQQEYYEFFAIFNQTEDSDKGDEYPTLPKPTPEQKQKTETLQGEIAALEKRMNETASPELQKELAAWENTIKQPTKWEPLAVTSLKSEKGVKLQQTEDLSILADAAESDVHTLEATTQGKRITGVMVEALASDSLPGKGPGRSGGGNFVLSEFKLSTAPVDKNAAAKRARYVRVSLPGKARLLHLAEVQVFSGGKNVATLGAASQSSTGFSGPANLANDGNTDGDYARKSVSHCAQQDDPWWEIDLKSEMPIDSVTVWNRTDGGTSKRTENFVVTALGGNRQEIFRAQQASEPNPSASFTLGGPTQIAFKDATADFEQQDYFVKHAIDGKDDTGWAVGPSFGIDHRAVFVAARPFGDAGKDTKLTFTLAQHYGSNHTLGRYRISITTDAVPQPAMPENIRNILAMPAKDRSPADAAALLAYYKPMSKTLADTRKELEAKQKTLAGIKPLAVPVMKEFAKDKQRESHFLVKGNFLMPGDKVEPALLKSFHKAPETGPASRLTVAHWLMSRDNPLTARVAVNRLWAQLFGRGLVETEEDFGTQGTLPTHPELLDYLAVQFMDLKWDMKAMIRELVMSRTYRQTGRPTAEAMKQDPRNEWLSHYPRRRLDAEQVRDQALALSGLLSPKMGGPSVYPPQPDGLWRAAFNGQRSWETSKGEDRYRRGLYTFWRRTVPYPSMATFDAPSRENSTMRRLPTNTPLQAFVTLNDPAYVEMAQALGARILREGGTTVEARVKFGLELCLARPVSDEQVTTLVQLYQQELANYEANPEDAKKLSTSTTLPAEKGYSPSTPPAEAAAWTAVANVLLNLDGVLTKG
ncbi:cytochrome c [Roseimicrobium gellanilyticum]|uniref:Cytochrome c n=1 Tax=Roseimicrobium gellanilyticum TaxID=748857 RepID=A0A366H052_9BACT|nr:DUF1553 domain-containing protein [Roseimicrobium gellanilyticum]RBP35211.1 cytochrome c [Roseimicrobium gellanilyticum]